MQDAILWQSHFCAAVLLHVTPATHAAQMDGQASTFHAALLLQPTKRTSLCTLANQG